MRIAKTVLFAVSLACAATAQGTILIDQNNSFIFSPDAAFCSLQASAICGQSFQQSNTNIAGAGISIREFGFVAGAQVTISIYSSYGAPPSGLIASGTALTSSPGWIDVFWTPAAVALLTTYYLVVESPVESLAAQESGFDVYPFGHAHLQGSLGNHSTADLAFRTYYQQDPEPVPEPGTLGLLGAGLLGLGLMRRKRAA